jgi:redox-sensitive bicupin YhaK (pirin superfamily)
VSPAGGEHAVRINQDVTIDAGVFEPGQSASKAFGETRYGWIQVVRGDLSLTVDGERLTIGEGDGVELAPGASIEFEATSAAEVLVFDLA